MLIIRLRVMIVRDVAEVTGKLKESNWRLKVQ